MNLFDTAAANATSIEQGYLNAKGSKSPEEALTVEEFVELVERDGCVSMNMHPWVLRDVLANGKHLNIYEWAEEQANLSGRSVDEILKEKLGRYYPRRCGFADLLDDGEKFRYGCLNIGGAGAPKYGVFCVVLKSQFSGIGKSVAYLVGDSLNEYTDSSGNVDRPRLESEAAPHSSRHHLAGMKHMDQVPSIAKEQRLGMLCSDDDYIEAIFVQDVGFDDFKEVRIKEKDYKSLKKLAFDDFSTKRRRGTHALVSEFNAILRAEKNGKIDIERL